MSDYRDRIIFRGWRHGEESKSHLQYLQLDSIPYVSSRPLRINVRAKRLFYCHCIHLMTVCSDLDSIGKPAFQVIDKFRSVVNIP